MTFTASAENLPPIVSGRQVPYRPTNMGKIRGNADTVLKMQLPKNTGLVFDVLTACDAHAHTHTHTHADEKVRSVFLINN